MATLTVTEDTDFRGGAAELNITNIVFQAANPLDASLTATFEPAQFGVGLISDTVNVSADPGAPNTLLYVVFSGAGSFSAAGWTFANWNEDDRLTIQGSSGDDTITGSSIGDWILGSGGADDIDAGAGNDTIQVLPVAAGLTVEGGAGDIDRLLTAASLTDLKPADISGVERLTFGHATAQTVIVGGDQIGVGGFRVVEAKAGAAATLQVEGDTVELAAITFVDWDGDDTIIIQGTSAFANTLSGSSQDDVISGTLTSIDFMTGGGGGDTLNGGDGPDVFLYAAGTDVVAGESVDGGTGTDIIGLTNAGSIDFTGAIITDVEALDFVNGNSTATVVSADLGPFGINSVSGSGGVDTLVVTVVSEFAHLGGVSFADWTAGVDTITINGSDFGDFIVGSSQSDTIFGGAGADVMVGGAGNDTYLVDNAGDTADESTGSGTDIVQSTVTFALAAGVENLILFGAGAVNGTGNASANAITGNSADNVLSGMGANDTLTAYGGADRLDGGSGADTLIGGNGNDTYVVDNAGDTASEASGSGIDTVQSTVTFTLAAGIENLVLNGTAAINGTGNASANTMSGNSAANVLSGLGANDTLISYGDNDRLDGGTGADAMTGGLGDDTYVVENAGDTTVEAPGGGNDTVQSTVSFTLAANVETLVLNGAAAIDGTGNANANTLYGNSAANRLDGDAGSDTMTGFGGADVFVFADGDGADTMTDFQNGSDTFDLTAVAAVDELSDLSIIDNGATVTIDYGTGSFTLANLGNPAELDAGDFLFA